jgi:diacylglycerol kinase (ATP)
MRAAAIAGPGEIARPLAAFQSITGLDWSAHISEDTQAAVIFGGDGTVHRYLSALSERKIPTLVVPCGSGNDFARALGIKSTKDSLAAWRAFVASADNVRTIDLGLIRCPGAHEPPDPHFASWGAHFFCCVAGVGIDTEVARKANRLPSWLRSHGGYALLAPREFIRFAPFAMKIETNGQHDGFHPTILAAIANAPAYGGGMKIAPQAKLDDGRLDLCVVRAMNRFKLFCLFPTVYFGRHVGMKEVEYSQTEIVRIETEYPLDVYADGEYICKTPVELGVARNALTVIVPI